MPKSTLRTIQCMKSLSTTHITGQEIAEQEKLRMGKVNAPEPVIKHFSHQHPLNLINFQPQQALFIAKCSCCLVNVNAEWIYTCSQCNYFLHISCSEMPNQITHPFDQTHILELLSKPVYPGGLFNCDACGKDGNGFSYHCGACKIDLHTTCAAMPIVITHQSHIHNLNLTFSIPYPNRMFSCDVCRNAGFKQWLYRCSFCEFDAHLDCARGITDQSVNKQGEQVQQYCYVQNMPSYGMPVQNFVSNGYGQSMGVPIANRSSGRGNSFLNQCFQNGMDSFTQNAAQALVQGLLGGGGGGSGGGGGGGGGGDGNTSSFNGFDIGGIGGTDLSGLGGLDFGLGSS